MAAKIYHFPNKIVLQGIQWPTYQALRKDLECQPNQRLTYDQGLLEIMTPLSEHESYKKLLDRIVEVTTEEMNIEIRSLGSCTWNREDLKQGLEPDECYYITSELAVRSKKNINLNEDPPPDLAIEIDITSSSINRLKIYAALGIKEIWRYDGADLFIYSLQNNEYQMVNKSLVLPILNRDDILYFLQQQLTIGETSLIRGFRQWIRKKLSHG
jgi:Uma2 family endonuclease